AIASRTAPTVSSGRLWKTPSPRAGISTPLLNFRTGLLLMRIPFDCVRSARGLVAAGARQPAPEHPGGQEAHAPDAGDTPRQRERGRQAGEQQRAAAAPEVGDDSPDTEEARPARLGR